MFKRFVIFIAVLAGICILTPFLIPDRVPPSSAADIQNRTQSSATTMGATSAPIADPVASPVGAPPAAEAAVPVAAIAPPPAPTEAEADKGSVYPTDEADLLAAANDFRSRYKAAANEFQKSSIRKQRAARLSEICTTRIANQWVGTISVMQTTSNGDGILSIKLSGSPLGVTVGTWNNSLSDIDSNTLISSGSRLYEEIASLAVGKTVMFSGTFLSSDQDFLKEKSLTELGSMDDPEFVFRFADIGVVSPADRRRALLPFPSSPAPSPAPAPTVQPTPQPQYADRPSYATPVSPYVPRQPNMADVSAVILHRVEPDYSEQARAAKFSGDIHVAIEIDERGNAARFRVLNSPGLGLDERIGAVLSQWKFRPAMKDGRPMSSTMTVTVMFRKP